MTRSQHREWIEATVLDYAKLNPPDGYDLSERIRQLASQGLKLRDISSLLGVHPEIVRRVLEAKANA